jgi:hypothetical protein
MLRNSVIAIAGLALLGFAIHAIADDMTPAPSDLKPRSHIVAPFNLLTDLSDDQKTKIREIHAGILEEEKQLRQKEHDQVMAVLTDDQKKELDDMVSKAAAQKKADEAEKRAKSEEEKAQQLKAQADGTQSQGATTQPGQ